MASTVAATSTTDRVDIVATGDRVDIVATGDGILVRLSGDLDSSVLGELRAALLAPRPATVVDVLVDAGAVTGADDAALAVLLAAAAWATETGVRFAYSRLSTALRYEAELLEVTALMPVLPGPGRRPEAVSPFVLM